DYPGDGQAVGDAEPVQVARLRSAMQHAEAVLVATPQYDRDVGGAMRNAFAWAARAADDGGRSRKPLAVMGPSCDERDMREAQAQLREALGDGRSEGDGDGGFEVIWSCVRADGERTGGRPGARAGAGDVRESVRGLLATLSDAAQPAGQTA
ncbi:MAG TPA: NAD(P)H-dependent oxidoreductase, partial [Thermoleophilia bacterium]|nr:NAD(P)H-dependent oxidoreductase [Thermoleophilia bacterium]